MGVGGTIPWPKTDRIAAQIQALLSQCSQSQSVMPQADVAKSVSRTEAAPHVRAAPTSQITTTSNVRAAIPPSMASISGESGVSRPVQPITQVSFKPGASTTAASQWDATPMNKGLMVSGQTSPRTIEMPLPQPASDGLPSSAQSSHGSSSTASSGGWAPKLELAIESSSQMQAALGLVNIAPYGPPSGIGASVPATATAINCHTYNNNNTAASNHAGVGMTASYCQYAQRPQQNGNHAVVGQFGQQIYGSMNARPWFH